MTPTLIVARADGYRRIIDVLTDSASTELDISKAMMMRDVLDSATDETAAGIDSRVTELGYELLIDMPLDDAYFAICGGGFA